MKMHIRKPALIVVLLLCLVISAGCGAGMEKSKTGAQASAESTTKKRMINDHLNRSVELPDNPQRVLALTRNFMEELFELGVTPVGKVEEYKNRPEGVALPSVSKQSAPDMEAIYRLKPDLIFANTRQHAAMLEGLEKSGAVVIFIDPNKVDNDPMTDRIKFMAEVLNRGKEAELYMQQLERVSNELKGVLVKSGYKTGLILEGTGEKGTAAQPTGFYGMLLDRLGIANIIPKGLPGSGASTWVQFDIETIVKANPDVIILKASGNDAAEHKALLEKFLGNGVFQDMNAVKQKKVFVLAEKIGPGNIANEEALKAFVKLIYTQGFKE